MKFTIKAKLIATLCIPLVVMGGFTIANLLNTKDAVLAVEKANVSSEFAKLLNANMKGQVDTLTLSIADYYEEAKLENVKKSLTAEMATFATTIENIYKSEDSKAEAKKSVYTFLNYHRWDNKRYLLAYDANSYMTRANGADVSKVGSNAFNDKDADDKYFVRDIVLSGVSNEIGFTEYSFLNPVTQTIERKITASFYFQPLNLVVASGEYISTLMQRNIDDAAKAVVNAKYGKNGYFWIQDKDGVFIAYSDTKLVGKSIPTSVQVAEAVKGKTEANVVIKYDNPATGETETKIVYVRNIFPEWGWSIATGAYESDIIAAEEGLTKATKDIFEEKANFIIISSIVLIIAAFLIAIWIVTAIVKGMIVLKNRIDTLSTGEADLTSRIDIVADNELGDIGKSVNTFIIYLQSMMREVSQASKHITENITQLNIQSEQNNKALLAHAAETEQVVSAITEMSATSDAVAQGASETSVNTQKANDQALISKDIVTEASNSVISLVDEVEAASASINTMNDNTQQIISVLSVIGAIAEQTNLLALNAAIEAARAGEQGRGFAVVADEVRSLAARTQTSTAEIGKILDTLRHDAATAVSAMDLTKASCERTAENTGRVTVSLDSMTDFIVEINDLSTQIATASEEQSSVSEEVSRNMVNIHEMVQELKRNGQASVDNTQNLATANAQLNALVSKFKL